MKVSDPDHPITVGRNPKRVRVSYLGETIAHAEIVDRVMK